MNRETKIWIAVGVIAVCLLLYLLGPILTPFLISALLAWLGDPMADRLEAWRFPRSLAVAVVFIGTFIVLGLLLLLIVPMVGHEVAEIYNRAPALAAWYQNTAVPWITQHSGMDPDRLRIQNLSGFLTDNVQGAGQLASNTLATVSHSGRAIFLVLINILLVPVITFYWLRDWDIFKARIAE